MAIARAGQFSGIRPRPRLAPAKAGSISGIRVSKTDRHPPGVWVPSSGSAATSLLLLVGERPGEKEAQSGRPFIGPSGEVLDHVLAAVGLHRSLCFLTNLVRDFIPGNPEPLPWEVERDVPKLLADIAAVHPKVVVAVGAYAARFFLGPDFEMETSSGVPSWWTHPGTGDRYPVVPVYHPANAFYKIGLLANLVEGMRQVARVMAGTVEPAVDSHPVPTYTEIRADDWQTAPGSLLAPATPVSPWVAIDTEGSFLRPWCLSYSQGAGEGTVLRELYGEFRMDLLAHVAAGGRVLLHNSMHDLAVLRALGIDLPVGSFIDTMVLAYLLCLEPQGLKALARRHSGMVMSSYDELLAPAAADHALDYVLRAWAQRDQWPPTPPYCILERDKVSRVFVPKEKKPWSIARYLERLVTDWEKGKRDKQGRLVDVRARWTGIDPTIRQSVEAALGPMPEATLDDIPESAAIGYACLAAGSAVMTEHGNRTLGSLVRSRARVRVWSLNTATGRLELKPVTGWYRVPQRRRINWLTVVTEHSRAVGGHGHTSGLSGARYTPDHRIWTTGGWKRVGRLATGDRVAMPMAALSYCQRQLTIGSMLGDGCIGRRNRDGWANLRFSNNDRQTGYVRWKAQLLGGLLSNTGITAPGTGFGCNGRPQVHVDSAHHPEFKEFHTPRTKRLGKWVRELDPLGLAIWYQDDGTLVGGRSARFYTLGFNYAEVELLRSILREKWGIASSALAVSGRTGQWFIAIPVESSKTLFDLIAPYVHDCMQYKLPGGFRGRFEPILLDVVAGPVWATVITVLPNPSSPGRRGQYRVSYCIDVADNHNFCTLNEVAHNCRDADATLRVYPHLARRVTDLGMDGVSAIDHSIIPMVERMQANGFLADVPHFTLFREELVALMDKHRGDIVRLTGAEINPDSPDQTAELLFDQLGLSPTKWTSGGKSGFQKPSTQDKVLEAMRFVHPVVPPILDFRECSKIKSAFCDPLPRLVERDGRIHTTLRITRVSSGRLASSKPNLMAQPVRSELGQRLRDGFIAPDPCPCHGRPTVLCDWDLDQAEMRMMAHESEDDLLVELFRDPRRDVHSETAARAFGISGATWENGYAGVDKLKHRYPAKRVGFGVITGITGKGLADQMAVAGATRNGLPIGQGGEAWTESDCSAMITEYFRIYRKVFTYMKRCRKSVHEDGRIADMWGRVRYLPGVYSIHQWQQEEAERQSHSHRIQAGAQGIIKVGMGKIWPYVLDMWKQNIHCEPLLQIHDSLIFEIDADWFDYWDWVVTDQLCHSTQLLVPMKAKGGKGRTWGDLAH